MSTRIAEILERLREAKYAAACASGRGAFGPREQQMLMEFQEHAIDDVEFLLAELEHASSDASLAPGMLEALRLYQVRTRKDLLAAPALPGFATTLGSALVDVLAAWWIVEPR